MRPFGQTSPDRLIIGQQVLDTAMTGSPMYRSSRNGMARETGIALSHSSQLRLYWKSIAPLLGRRNCPSEP